jgi:hypothetical protein
VIVGFNLEAFMIISGSIQSGYIFQPHFTELKDFKRIYGGIVKPCFDGWTFRSYDNVELFHVINGIYEGVEAVKTRSFNNPTLALRDLKSAVDSVTGEVLNAEKGILLPISSRLDNNANGFTANHIPQIFGLYPTSFDHERLCSGFHGNFDLIRRTFHGQADFITLGALWIE